MPSGELNPDRLTPSPSIYPLTTLGTSKNNKQVINISNFWPTDICSRKERGILHLFKSGKACLPSVAAAVPTVLNEALQSGGTVHNLVLPTGHGWLTSSDGNSEFGNSAPTVMDQVNAPEFTDGYRWVPAFYLG